MYREAVLAQMGALALNRGRPAEGQRIRQEQRSLEAARSNRPSMHQIWDALYWDGDTAAASAAARDLGAIQAALPTNAVRRDAYSCVLEQWRLGQGQLATTRRSIAEMRRAQSSPDYPSASVAIARGCAILLEALLGAAEKRADAGRSLKRLDSLMLTGPPYRNDNLSWNLVLARLKEAQGDRQGALAATRRRVYQYAEPLFLSTYLREEGRLAALTGDRKGAIQAYQHYLALRADPEPTLRPQVEQIQAELTKLLNEPSQ